MKATFKADNEKHREIVKMFVGCETESGDYLGFHKYYMGGTFATQHKGSFHTMYSDQITLDLDHAKPDLRLAIGTDIEFRLPHYKTSRKLRTAKFDEDGKVFNFNHFFGTDAKKIKLCPDYLKRIGVDVKE